MEIKCECCGAMIPDTVEKCPYCDFKNEKFNLYSDDIPETMKDLENWCIMTQIPLIKIRCFIGQDTERSDTHGIYKENENTWQVYYYNLEKHKRIIYSGDDEYYAVVQMYNIIMSELTKIGRKPIIPKPEEKLVAVIEQPKKKMNPVAKVLLTLAIIIMTPFVILFIIGITIANTDNYLSSGYYKIGNEYYYSDYTRWYKYTNDGWEIYTGKDIPYITSQDYIGWDAPSYKINFDNSGYVDPKINAYFIYNDIVYFFYYDKYDWFIYNNGWIKIKTTDVPFELKKNYLTYVTADFDNLTAPTGVENFRNSEYFIPKYGYYKIGDDVLYNDDGTWYLYNPDIQDYELTSEPLNAKMMNPVDYSAVNVDVHWYSSKAYKKKNR